MPSHWEPGLWHVNLGAIEGRHSSSPIWALTVSVRLGKTVPVQLSPQLSCDSWGAIAPSLRSPDVRAPLPPLLQKPMIFFHIIRESLAKSQRWKQ